MSVVQISAYVSEVQSYPWESREFENSMGYVRPSKNTNVVVVTRVIVIIKMHPYCIFSHVNNDLAI